MHQDAVKMVGSIIPVSFSSPKLRYNDDVKSETVKAFICSCDLRKGVPIDGVYARVLKGEYC